MGTQVSSVVTGGVAMTATTLTPLVQWALTGFRAAMPAEVPMVVAGLIFTGIHALTNYANSRGKPPVSIPPSTGGQQ